MTDPETDTEFHRRREAEERASAAASSCMVREVHLELAEAYAELVEQDGRTADETTA